MASREPPKGPSSRSGLGQPLLREPMFETKAFDMKKITDNRDTWHITQENESEDTGHYVNQHSMTDMSERSGRLRSKEDLIPRFKGLGQPLLREPMFETKAFDMNKITDNRDTRHITQENESEDAGHYVNQHSMTDMSERSGRLRSKEDLIPRFKGLGQPLLREPMFETKAFDMNKITDNRDTWHITQENESEDAGHYVNQHSMTDMSERSGRLRSKEDLIPRFKGLGQPLLREPMFETKAFDMNKITDNRDTRHITQENESEDAGHYVNQHSMTDMSERSGRLRSKEDLIPRFKGLCQPLFREPMFETKAFDMNKITNNRNTGHITLENESDDTKHYVNQHSITDMAERSGRLRSKEDLIPRFKGLCQPLLREPMFETKAFDMNKITDNRNTGHITLENESDDTKHYVNQHSITDMAERSGRLRSKEDLIPRFKGLCQPLLREPMFETKAFDMNKITDNRNTGHITLENESEDTKHYVNQHSMTDMTERSGRLRSLGQSLSRKLMFETKAFDMKTITDNRDTGHITQENKSVDTGHYVNQHSMPDMSESSGRLRSKEKSSPCFEGLGQSLSRKLMFETKAFDMKKITDNRDTGHIIQENKSVDTGHYVNQHSIADMSEKFGRSRSKGKSSPCFEDQCCRIEVILGELAKQKVDVIVNTSNDKLRLDSGAVSNPLLKIAGQEMQREVSKTYPQGIKPGQIAESMGYRLGVSRVLHCSLFSWSHYSEEKRSVCRAGLVQVVQKSLERTAQLNKTSIAFPALGTGELKYPPEVVARDMINTVQQHYIDNPDTSIKRVLFVIYSKDLVIHKVFKSKLDEKTGRYENTEVSDYCVVIAGSKDHVAEAKTHIGKELLSVEEPDVDIAGRRQEHIIEANFSKKDDLKHNERKPNGHDLLRDGPESYATRDMAIVGMKSEDTKSKERKLVTSANTLLTLDEMLERNYQEFMWKNDSYRQTGEEAFQTRELKRPGHQNSKDKIASASSHTSQHPQIVDEGQNKSIAGYSAGLTPDKGARPKIPTIDISGRLTAGSYKKGFLQRDQQPVSKRGCSNLKTRLVRDDPVTDEVQQTPSLVSADMSTGGVKSGERTGKEVQKRDSDKITSREDKEVRIRESDEISSSEYKELRIRESDKITSREYKEVGIRDSDEITSREDKEAGIRDSDEVQRSLDDSSDSDSVDNGAKPKNPTTGMGYLDML